MSEQLAQLYATDKDLHDLLASAKQRLTEAVLRELASERGIFYSPHDTRDDLVESISILPHTYQEVTELISRRETSRRNEKTTFVALDGEIPLKEIRDVVAEYQAEMGKAEKVDSHYRGANAVAMNLEYDEIDYSRTRLIQRTRQDATFTFTHEDGKTIVRFPATEKAQRVVDNLTDRVEKNRRAPLVRNAIMLDPDFTAHERTTFFTRLMAEMAGHKLNGVTKLRIAPSEPQSDADEPVELDEDERAEAERNMLAVVVRSMGMSGENLMAAPEYQALKKRGFFVTAVTWKGLQTSPPYDKNHLHAEFQDGEKGKDFRLAIKGVYRSQEGGHTKSSRPVTDSERELLTKLIERTAQDVLADMRTTRAAAKAQADEDALPKTQVEAKTPAEVQTKSPNVTPPNLAPTA
ncbi:hypothetical protein [Delftia sp. CH05]|uniref:hypothetical protein n=1 Tax=Delftia sp. CH05 TaxID=2692194 RepID=UPI00135F0328|nr:hypothetical protein [Delftia sp. CH05]MXN28145.1 hypothetical protein [Delftia sp. CH05]